MSTWKSQRLASRREFLRMSAMLTGATFVAACAPGVTTPTGSATPQPLPSATPETLGKFVLGPVEGPVVITDVSKYPKAFKESPDLAALVSSGKLPKVADRIGPDPIVVQTLQSVGKYGGNLTKSFIGAGDYTNFAQFGSGPDTLLYWDYAWNKARPNIAKSFDVSTDGKVLSLTLRKMFWSSGDPLTTEDVRFWYDDIYQNKALVAAGDSTMFAGGQPVTIKIVDDQTFQFISQVPNYLMIDTLASTGGMWFNSFNLITYIAPSKYLKQFHPKYAAGGQDALDTKAKAAGLTGWAQQFTNALLMQTSADTPTLGPWIMRKGNEINKQTWVFDRNPYSVWVDTDGNQLPYLNTVTHSLATTAELIDLRTLAGENDFQEYTDPNKLPLYVDGQDKGAYKIWLNPSEGNDYGLRVNLSNNLNADGSLDTEFNTLIQTADFRRALSLGIDRSQINEAFFLGLARPGSYAPQRDTNKYFPGADVVNKWSTFDVAQANKLLDGLGLTAKDSAGFRLRKDGKTRISISHLCIAGRAIDYPGMAEMIKRTWAQIGIDSVISAVTTQLYSARLAANQFNVIGFTVGSEDLFLSPGRAFPSNRNELGSDYVAWFSSNGTKGKEPFKELKDLMDLWNRAYIAAEPERIKMGKQWWAQAVDLTLQIGVVGAGLSTNGFHFVKNSVGNVPRRMINSQGALHIPRQALAHTFYFK